MREEQRELIRFLKRETVPACGCTEPVAAAFCAASAAACLPGEATSAEVEVNPNLYKNGMSAGIPNFDGVGLAYAAALGLILRDPGREMELLEDVTEPVATAARRLADSGAVRVTIAEGERKLFIRCRARSGQDECVCTVRDAHTNVVSILVNGEERASAARESGAAGDGFLPKLMSMTFREMRELIEGTDAEALAFLADGIEMNERLSEAAGERSDGIGLARTLEKYRDGRILSDDLMGRVQRRIVAATEKRLSGCPFPAMSSSGSGTKGIVVILPVSEAAKAFGVPHERLLRALAFGHCVNRYINEKTGKLAPVCTCAVAAATAASAAVTWMLGGDDERIAYAVRNMTGTITGMVCDGGKIGCALKVATAATAALICALEAAEGVALRPMDGVCGVTAEECVGHIARIADPGMAFADREILSIMLEKDARRGEDMA